MKNINNAPKDVFQSMQALWDHVCSGSNDYAQRTPHHHERRFLEALHSHRSIALLAQELSQCTGRPVSVGSAFIDSNPEFKWGKEQGEIGDILLLIHRADGKLNQHRACIVQTKVSDSKSSLDNGSSTAKQLRLYEDWPEIEFSSAIDLAALKVKKNAQNKFKLNRLGAKWPFNFLRICNIATPVKDNAPAVPTPSWNIKSRRNQVTEPFSVIGKIPCVGAMTVLDWLKDAVSDSVPSGMEVTGASATNLEFTELVKSLLVVLTARQAASKFGASGGSLMNSLDVGLHFDHLVKFIPAHLANSVSPEDANRRDEEKLSALSEDGRGFLVICIELGAEGNARREVSIPAPRRYPGSGFIF